MKKVCFVVSHLGSGSGSLVASLNSHPQCEIQESPTRYDSPSAVRWLFRIGHKCRDASAVYGDHLLFNSSISSRVVYGLFKFIFVVRPARHSLTEIMRQGYGPAGAASYYRFRLRRICEVAKRAPGSVILSWEQLAREDSLRIIESHLGLSKPLRALDLGEPEDGSCPESVIEECQDAYDRYHYYLKGLQSGRKFDKAH